MLSISYECDRAHTALPVPPQNPRDIWCQETDMAQEPDRLAFRFGVVIAVVVIVSAIMTWAAPQILKRLGWANPDEGSDLSA